MEAIKNTIGKIMVSLDAKKNSTSNDLDFLLKKLLTKKELRHIKINYFSGGVLNVLVDSSVWLYQLSLKKEVLLVDLRKSVMDIREIRFRLGEIK